MKFCGEAERSSGRNWLDFGGDRISIRIQGSRIRIPIRIQRFLMDFDEIFGGVRRERACHGCPQTGARGEGQLTPENVEKYFCVAKKSPIYCRWESWDADAAWAYP